MNILHKICFALAAPLRNHAVLVFAAAILLFCPAMIYRLVSEELYFQPLSIQIQRAVLYLFVPYALMLAAECFPRRIREIPAQIVFLALALVSATESFLILFFDAQFSPFLAAMCMETTPRESSEFFSTYLLTGGFLLLVAVTLVVIAGIEFFHFRFKARIGAWLTTWPKLLLLTPLFCLVGATAFVNYQLPIYRSLFRCDTPFAVERSAIDRGAFLTPCDRMIYSFYTHSLTINTLSEVRKTQAALEADPKAVGKSTRPIEDLVLIIGESFNKHHSSLYGYPLPTSPRLAAEPNLSVYTDVVAPYNTTSNVLQSILSFKSLDTDDNWASTPLLPALYKKAGYDVYFISNQIIRNNGNLFDFAGGYFLNDGALQEQLFTARNKRTHRFDQELIGDYKALASEKPKHPRLVIFHLLGQHVSYSDRSPKEFKKFTTKDINPKIALDEAGRRQIADFDNSVLYNDYVVDSILNLFKKRNAVVIYLSDHGDEVNDYREHIGRSYEEQITPEVARNQFEIPMMIWTSDRFRAANPEIAEQIASSVSRPFMSDDLPHLLLDIAGLPTPWFKAERSPINPLYRAGRPRLMLGKHDYDIIMGQNRPQTE